MTGVVALADADDGDEHVLDRVPCRCGALAAIVINEDSGMVSVEVRCGCGTFAVPDASERG